ncbi:MAG TPA: hypothetical protein GXZ36_02825 [Firmicutes bacterium]|nr:hypothetical protein [Bacillota bacterium]
MSACSVLRRIENILQQVTDFLGNPAAFTQATADNLSQQIELVRGGVRNLPLARGPKNDILARLNQAQFLLSNNNLSTVELLLAVINILQVAAMKVKGRKLPCGPGLVTVHPSNRLSTICNFCK